MCIATTYCKFTTFRGNVPLCPALCFKRDMKRIYANKLSRWTRYNPSLMAWLTKTKAMTQKQRGRLTIHLFDWMAHARNLCKWAPAHQQDETLDALSVVCRRHSNISMWNARIRRKFSWGKHASATSMSIFRATDTNPFLKANVGLLLCLNTWKTIYGTTQRQVVTSGMDVGHLAHFSVFYLNHLNTGSLNTIIKQLWTG